MIFYGTRAKSLGAQALGGVACQSCGQSGVVAHVFQKYFHIFWIPVLPYKKLVATECARCQQALAGEDVPPMYQAQLETFRASVKTPWYMYTGLVLILFLVAGGYYVYQKNQELRASYVAHPQVGDLYVIDVQKGLALKDAQYPFRVLKITNVKDKTVTLVSGHYEYSAASGATEAIDAGKADELAYFLLGDEFSLSIEQLQTLLGQGHIRYVTRRGK